MLDDINYLNQFGLNKAFAELEGLFQTDFYDNLPAFSVNQATIQQPYLSQGTKAALEFINNPNFRWKAASESQIIIDDEKINLAQVKIENWTELAFLLQLAGHDIKKNLQELQSIFRQLKPDQPTATNQAKQLSLYLAGKSALILTSENWRMVGDWWRWQIENQAANLCFNQHIAEVNPAGWGSHPIEKQFGIVDVISLFDSTDTKQRFLVKNRILSGKMPAAKTLQLQTQTAISQALEALLIGQATSYYLAALNKQTWKPNLFLA